MRRRLGATTDDYPRCTRTMSNTNRARAARPDDAPRMGEVHVRAWQVAYRGLMPDAYLDGLAPEERAAMWQRGIDDPWPRTRIILAERDGTCRGFAVLGPVSRA